MEYIDLGLSVKWAKYNLGATGGSDISSWLGDYYAWGEIFTKYNNGYNGTNYIHGNINTYGFPHMANLNKYNKLADYGITDNKDTLESVDDVINVSYGGNWRMPTKAELEELILLPNKWVTDYNGINGLIGRIFIGNGNTLFIPAAGSYENLDNYNAGFEGYLWASSLYSNISLSADMLYFNNKDMFIIGGNRFYGLPVRGVCS